MNYFEVYLKRINRYGTTLQERIQGKKEHDFKVFMSKSPNLVMVRDNSKNLTSYNAVLQTKEYDQDEVIDYLLVPLDKIIPMGTIIYTKDSRHTSVIYEDKEYEERRWINYAIDPYTNIGYNRYTIVELESELSWVLNGIKYTSFAHATGGGSGARDKNINLKFRVQFSESGVYLPNKRYSIIMPYNEHLKKNMKVTLGGETWRVAGFDNISVKGVSYITLEETLQDTIDDNPIANYGEIKYWEITTSLGNDFTISDGKEFDLLFFYKGQKSTPNFTIKPSDSQFSVEVTDNRVKIIANTSNLPISTYLAIYIEGWAEDNYIKLPFTIVNSSELKTSTIIGKKEIYVGEIVDYTIKGANDNDFSTLKLENSSAEIVEKDITSRTVKILGKSIGKNRLFSENGLFSQDFEVFSTWLRGGVNVN